MAAQFATVFGRMLSGLAVRAAATRAGTSAAGVAGKKAAQPTTMLGRAIHRIRGNKTASLLGVRNRPFDAGKIKFPSSLGLPFNTPGASAKERQQYEEHIQDRKNLYLKKKRMQHEQDLQRISENTASSIRKLGKSASFATLLSAPAVAYRSGTSGLLSGEGLKNLNASIARSVARQKVNTLQRNIERGRATSATFRFRTEQASKLEKSIAPAANAIENMTNVAIGMVSAGASFITEWNLIAAHLKFWNATDPESLKKKGMPVDTDRPSMGLANYFLNDERNKKRKKGVPPQPNIGGKP